MDNELIRVLDAIPGLAWTALPDGFADHVNERWCEYTGLGAAEAAGRGWQIVVHPDDLPALLAGWHSIVASGKPGELEARMRRFDGEYRWFLFRTGALKDASGQVLKWCVTNADIEDRKRAEETLRQRELSFRLIVDSIPAPVAVTTPSGQVEGLNRPTLEYFGKTFEELKDWSGSEVVHPDDLQQTVAAQRKAHDEGSAYNVESRHRRADGVYRWFNVLGVPLRDRQGRILRWFHLQLDIDDRKRAEEALTLAERDLSSIINSIPALAWSARPDGSAEFFNQHYLEYLGLAAEQARDWGWTAGVHPDDLEGLTAAWQRILASRQAGESEARLRRHDGEYRWFLFRVNPQRNEAGHIVKWYGINTDIDDRKRAEEERRRSEAFLAEGQRLSLTGSFSWRPDTDEITFSNELFRIFEFEERTPLSLERIRARIHADDIPLLAEQMAQGRDTGAEQDYEIRLRMPDGSVKILHTVSHTMAAQDGRLEYIGAIQDVTQRRASEEALGKLRSELAHLARVSSLGALTASIAHEVNQPLSGIITNASACQRMLTADPPNVDGALETVRRTIRDGNRASEVITRLRALFTNKAAATEPVNLNEATQEVIALSQSTLKSCRVILRTELADDVPPVTGDRVQLQQVILNLLHNASEAMTDVDDRPRQVVIRTEKESDDRVRLSVQDSGVGFGPQGVNKLFEAFHTTKGDGMGIGLSISRSIIERHHGHLWAAPNDGPGATFSFSIPRGPG